MDLRELKDQISSKTLRLPLQQIVFEWDEESQLFIIEQYIREISRILNLDISYIDEQEYSSDSSIFTLDNVLNVYRTDNLIFKDQTNTIVILHTKHHTQNYVSIPKIEKWMIEDYVKSQLKIDSADAEWLCRSTKYNIFRLENEINKLKNSVNQKYLFNLIYNDNGYSDLSENIIWDFTNALLDKNRDRISTILSENVDITGMGLSIALTSQVKQIIDIVLNIKSTPESSHTSQKQYYFIKNNRTNWGEKELVGLYSLLTSIDYKVKTGLIDSDNIIDMILLEVFK